MKKKEKSDFETDIEALYSIDGNGSRLQLYMDLSKSFW